MFSTSIKSQCRTRPATTASLGNRYTIQLTDAYPASQHKIKQLKQQLKAMQEQYKNSLTNVNKIKSSIEKTNKQACMTRLSFMKMYESKKVKMEDHYLTHQLKVSRIQHSRNCSRKTRERKVNQQLNHFVVKAEQGSFKQDLRKKNKTEKLLRKQKIQQKKNYSQMQAKSQFQKIKDSELYLKARKRKIAQMQALRARQNYMNKMGGQMALISTYNNILQKVSNWEEMQEIPDNTKSFFITKDND